MGHHSEEFQKNGFWTSTDGDGQLVMEFEDGKWPSSDTYLSGGRKMDLSAFFRRLKMDYKRSGEKATTRIEDMGHRIFDIQVHNDFKSVEGDYGAPAIGLEWFKNVIDPVRSFRYERVHYQDGGLKTHVRQANDIAHSMRAQGFKIFKGSPGDQLATHIYFANGGVTRAFSDLVDALIDEYQKLQTLKQQVGRGHEGAFLVPVPTYGLFYYRMLDAVRGTDISIIPVRRREDGGVDLASLTGTLQRCREDNVRVLAYYDCNPQNPTGYIRGREETTEIAQILINESARYMTVDGNYLEQYQHDAIATHNAMRFVGKSYRNFDPSTLPSMSRWVASLSKPQAGIVMIDDMAYEDLQYDAGNKPFSFGQVSKEVAAFTAVLKGISKIGLPGARIGMMIGHNELTGPLQDRQLIDEFAAHSLGVDLLSARFGAATHKKEFRAHYDRLRVQHTYKLGVVEAFFHGLDNTDRLSPKQKEKLVADYAGHAGIETDDARSTLKKGLPNLPLVDQAPECGFFHRINAEALKGRMIAVREDANPYPDFAAISNSYILDSTFRSFGIHVIPASWQGCPPNDMTVRVTMSLPDKELMRLYDNMRAMHDYFWAESREAQLDLFRRNNPAPV